MVWGRGDVVAICVLGNPLIRMYFLLCFIYYLKMSLYFSFHVWRESGWCGLGFWSTSG